VDWDKEVVLSKGMDDSHFKLNPIVTLQHCYYMPPVGKSVWRKKGTVGNRRGIKAKTQYPKKPDDWPPDVVSRSFGPGYRKSYSEDDARLGSAFFRFCSSIHR